MRIPMSQIRLVVLLISALSARAASADIIYTFTTTNPANLAGRLSGSFTVPDSAIADGFIAASEIKTYRFTLATAKSPFNAATFVPPDTLSIASPFASMISVDPVSGQFLADSAIGIIDGFQRLSVTTYPGTVFPLVPQYQIETAFGQLAQGQGLWTVQRTLPQLAPVPVLNRFGYLVLAMTLAISHFWWAHRHLTSVQRNRDVSLR